jgi:hypothetical protein
VLLCVTEVLEADHPDFAEPDCGRQRPAMGSEDALCEWTAGKARAQASCRLPEDEYLWERFGLLGSHGITDGHDHGEDAIHPLRAPVLGRLEVDGHWRDPAAQTMNIW